MSAPKPKRGRAPDLQTGARIKVGNVRQLYAEARKRSNAGATIHVVAGRYVLDAAESRFALGRLILAPGVNLQGETVLIDSDNDGVPDKVGAQTVIDGSAIDWSALGSRAAIIEAGRGNRIQQISVIGPGRNGPGSGIGTSLVPNTEEIALEVLGCHIQGTGLRGIQFIRLGPAASAGGRVVIQGNLIEQVGSLAATGKGHGIQVVIAGAVNGALLSAEVSRNHVRRSRTGLTVERNQGSSSLAGNGFDVTSSGNIFECNRNGIGIGFTSGTRDSMELRSDQDRLNNNSGGSGFGILLLGTNEDTMRIWLRNTTILGNTPIAFAANLADVNATNNNVNVSLERVTLPGGPLPPFSIDTGAPQNQNRVTITGQ